MGYTKKGFDFGIGFLAALGVVLIAFELGPIAAGVLVLLGGLLWLIGIIIWAFVADSEWHKRREAQKRKDSEFTSW